ncbi:tRNA-dihydrouridine(47) synthase [NAD(P)(+)]-like protein [Coemansia guatemalensis]|uniref:tRNA-dihydrouridine(47) synthase [NAD(P)(+)] n=1 Tax=Coemansia guatemalensis TaxID=2761395 RepID=A0A9W8HVE8_9FUNG|nr:tRNA-dihydrouridine(47) synthase [NAD(P)(+)]-like protein [Coemansia guatemalensis]
MDIDEPQAVVTTSVGNSVAPIKKEFLVVREPSTAPSANESTEKRETGINRDRYGANSKELPAAKDKLCPRTSVGLECNYSGECKFTHDIESFMAKKGPDLGRRCPVFEAFGTCEYGLRCRFAQAHTTANYRQIVDEDKVALSEQEKKTFNHVSKDMLIRLRKKKVDFPRTRDFERVWEAMKGNNNVEEDGDIEEEDDTMRIDSAQKRQRIQTGTVDFRGKTYLGPLTTLGNLPFRRTCKGFGVDITCSEMALASNILQGKQSELALLRRHESEDIFGVQLAGRRADVIGRATEFISAECNVDFIDLNLGCPIELAYNKGSGSALLTQPWQMERIVRTIRYVSDCDITVKFRTGIKPGDNLAHKLIPKFERWGAVMGTLHGRSRQQRYTKYADWEYIARCRQATGQIPLFGGGDVLSWEDYWDHLETQKQCDGVMIGRGALIKPWIFREINERRVWDISANERLDILKDFARFGMEHWGTDAHGIATTRRYLLEWQSFLHRYVPAGILEVLPQKMNDRPPAYYGRNDLETLMASSSSKDWIKISEMVLGPAPDGFTFIPKHKSNSYDD